MHKSESAHRLGAERPKRKKGKKLDRLTRDAIAAEKAGMSYGKYKAQHPYTPEEEDEDDPLEVDLGDVLCTCVRCGQPFVKKQYQTMKKYCSDECRKKYDKKRYEEAKRAKPGKPAVCAVCGADFMADHQHRKYCSTECAMVGQRRRTKALQKEYKALGGAKNGSN